MSIKAINTFQYPLHKGTDLCIEAAVIKMIQGYALVHLIKAAQAIIWKSGIFTPWGYMESNWLWQ